MTTPPIEERTYDHHPEPKKGAPMTTYFVLLVEGGTTIETRGPFTHSKDREAAAIGLRAKIDQDTDSVFWMNITTDPLRPGSYPTVTTGEYAAATFAKVKP